MAKPGRVHRAEERRLDREHVIGRGLANVVLPGPQEATVPELAVPVLLQLVFPAHRPGREVVVVGGSGPLARGVVLPRVEQLRVLVHPAAGGLRAHFRAEEELARVFRVQPIHGHGGVVVDAEPVQLAQDQVLRRAGGGHAAVLVRAHHHRPGGVDRLDVGNQLLGDSWAAGRPGVWGLIADRPQHDGGRILRGVHHLLDVGVAPLVEVQVVVVRQFAGMPAVERFDHHQDAEPLADLDEFRGGRIVRGAQGIDAHAPHQFHLPGHRVIAHRRADRAFRGVQVDAVDLQVLAVQRQPLGRVEA